MESLSSLSPTPSLTKAQAQTQESLAALSAKTSSLTHLLQFLLAKVYLSRANHIPYNHNLKPSNWPTLHPRPPWRQIIFVIRNGGTDDEYASHRPYDDDFLVEPAKALGIDRRDMKAHVRAVPLGEWDRVLVYWTCMLTVGIRMRL